MTIESFEGNTFVAFIDISGFKEMMKEGNNRAWKALHRFYNCGYQTLRDQEKSESERVEGLFLSDCGVLFVRTDNNNNAFKGLLALLKIVKNINSKMLSEDTMLTTSIAYGHFKYQERVEFSGIEKNAVYGQAYVSSFLDNEGGKPKIKPAQCRIVKENIPEEVEKGLRIAQDKGELAIVDKKNHWYFYWMVEKVEDIKLFENQYKYANKIQYIWMLKALKGESLQQIK